MPGPLTIDWKPLDFSGMEQIPLLYQAARKSAAQEESLRQNAETQRMYAANQDRKLSADLARADWEQKHRLEREQHQDEIATSTALPTIMRVAAGNPGLGGAMGKPYGIDIGSQETKQYPVDTTIPGDATPTGASAAKFLAGGGIKDTRPPLQGPTPAGPSLADPNQDLLNFKPPTAQPEVSPDVGPEAGPAGMHDPIDTDAETAARVATAPTTRSYYAAVHGQRFPVQSQPDAPFGEAKYDALYQRLLAQNPTADPTKVEAKVLQMRGQDLVNARGERGLDLREETLGSLDDYRGKSLALSDLNNRRNNAAKLAAARLIATGMNEKTAVGLIGQYNQYDKSAQAAALMKQDQQGMRVEDRVAMELDPTNPNALNQAMAQHSIAALSVSMGGTGVRVPVSVIHDIKTAYSAALSFKNTVYRQLHGGENSPEVVAVMNDAVGKLKQLSSSNRENDFKVWENKAGLRSPWARNAETLGLVMAARAAVRAQLRLPDDDQIPNMEIQGLPGMEPPPETEAPQRPTVPVPARAPKHKAASPAGGGDPQRAKAQKAMSDPHAPPEAKAAALKLYPDLGGN